MPGSDTPRLPLAGDVSERTELLNGAMQLALDGATTEGGRYGVTLTIAWRLGREGAIPLEEGDLTLDDPATDDAETVAILDAGTAEEDIDTGNAVIDATFTIEESNVDALPVGGRLRCQLEVAAEQWTGSLVLAEDVEAD